MQHNDGTSQAHQASDANFEDTQLIEWFCQDAWPEQSQADGWRQLAQDIGAFSQTESSEKSQLDQLRVSSDGSAPSKALLSLQQKPAADSTETGLEHLSKNGEWHPEQVDETNEESG